jgi:hypothetical protein
MSPLEDAYQAIVAAGEKADLLKDRQPVSRPSPRLE